MVCGILCLFRPYQLFKHFVLILSGWQVDQAILSEEDRVVVIRFGHDWVSVMFRKLCYET